MCANLHVYIYVIASESGSGIRVPSPSRNVYLEIDGELLLDRVQLCRKQCIFGHARPLLSTNNISSNISTITFQGQAIFALISLNLCIQEMCSIIISKIFLCPTFFKIPFFYILFFARYMYVYTYISFCAPFNNLQKHFKKIFNFK